MYVCMNGCLFACMIVYMYVCMTMYALHVYRYMHVYSAPKQCKNL